MVLKRKHTPKSNEYNYDMNISAIMAIMSCPL